MPLRIVTPPASQPRALDQATMAAKLGATSQADDVGKLIGQMTALAEELSGLHLWYRGYKEVIEGADDDRLYLTARPIVAVTSVRRGSEDPLTEGTDSDDEFEVWHRQGFLDRPNCWPSCRPYWSVEFTAGWWLPSMGDDVGTTGATKLADDRADVERAIEEMVTLQWQIDSGDRRIKSARLSSMAVQYQTDLWVPKGAMRVVKGLRRLVA